MLQSLSTQDPIHWISFLLLAPFVLFLVFGISSLWGTEHSEGSAKRLLEGMFFISIFLNVVLFLYLYAHGFKQVHHVLRSPFLSYFGLDFSFTLSPYRLCFLALICALVGLVGRFAFSYMHLESGFLRFFTLFSLFLLGMELIALAGSLQTLFVGWEFVGLSSVLLIAYFQERKDPVQRGMYVFSIYRVGDVAFLALCVWVHARLGTTDFEVIFSAKGQAWWGAPGNPELFFLGALILLVVVVKSSLFPFLNWLPRAMEGPTPSSAVFYGSLSTHAGIFFLMLMMPFFHRSKWLMGLLFAISILTAVYASIIERLQPDAKNALAYSTVIQLSIIVFEIAMGWTLLAQIHLLSHAVMRTYQFLKTPSLLHEHHEMEGLLGESFAPTGVHLERLFPKNMQKWLYRFALERAYLDTFWGNTVMGSLEKFSSLLNRTEARVICFFAEKEGEQK